MSELNELKERNQALERELVEKQIEIEMLLVRLEGLQKPSPQSRRAYGQMIAA